MTTPKSATEIMKEWDERVWATMAEGDAWLRAAAWLWLKESEPV